MIDQTVLRANASARLLDAQTLLAGLRYDTAVYICGYSIELALKARICDTLGWPGYPETKKDFEGLLSFKIHNLERLLHLSGWETYIRANHLTNWSVVKKWDPESRYKPPGHTSAAEALLFLQATATLLNHL